MKRLRSGIILRWLRAFYASILMCLFFSPAIAGQQETQTASLPITVEANDGIEWIAESKIYVARGNAIARQGSFSVNADVLTARYRDTKSNKTEIYLLEAIGNVVVSSPERTAYGDKGIYDIDESNVLLTGKNLRLVTVSETITADKSLEYQEDKNLAVARGNAVASQNKRNIRADILSIYFDNDKQGNLKAKRIDAAGNVKITTPEEVIRGDKGVYNLMEGLATLSGNVKITRGENQLNGAVAEVNLNTGISRLLSNRGAQNGSRVRGLFTPKNQHTN